MYIVGSARAKWFDVRLSSFRRLGFGVGHATKMWIRLWCHSCDGAACRRQDSGRRERRGFQVKIWRRFFVALARLVPNRNGDVDVNRESRLSNVFCLARLAQHRLETFGTDSRLQQTRFVLVPPVFGV